MLHFVFSFYPSFAWVSNGAIPFGVVFSASTAPRLSGASLVATSTWSISTTMGCSSASSASKFKFYTLMSRLRPITRLQYFNTHLGIALNFKMSNLQSQNLSFSSQECFVFEPGMFWLESASALHLSCHERLGTWGCLRDISEISWGRRDLMLMWTQTKTPLAWSCEHKLNHKQTKHNPRCLYWRLQAIS